MRYYMCRSFFIQIVGFFVFILTLGFGNELKGQIAVKQSFEDLPKDRVKIGINGFALNLGEDAHNRKPVELTIDKNVFSTSFSLLFWVKAAPDGFDYDIATLDFVGKDSLHTEWTIGKQANGAWSWVSTDKGKVNYQYRPTAARQSIASDEWSMIGVNYDAEHEDIWFYYNGENVAIYHVGSKYPSDQGVQLSIGGKQIGALGEWHTFNGSIDELEVHSSFLLPREMKNRYQEFYTKDESNGAEEAASELKVMSFNIWHGGNETGKYIGPQRVANMIRDNGIDIVALQETYGSGEQIADALGYYFYLRSTNLSILSKFPIEETLPAHHPFYSGAARIGYRPGKQIAFVTNWLNYPVDYWDLFENGKTIDSLEWYKQQVAGNKGTLAKILEVLRPALHQTDSIPLIFCGDFNSGSHLDWIGQTKHLNNGHIMPFPSSQLMYDEGFKDSYRQAFSDPVQDRGITWSPTFTNAFKDRIDYIYYKGQNIKVKDSAIINSALYKFPSDHAAVITTFQILY